jgi:hypothetical protein
MTIRVRDDVEDGCLLCGDVVVQSGEWKCIFGQWIVGRDVSRRVSGMVVELPVKKC